MKIVLEKRCFQTGFVFFKKIYKEKYGKGASKTKWSLKSLINIWELCDIREVHFGTLVISLHCNSGD